MPSTNFAEPVALGKSGLTVGRLGIGASYGAPARSIEAAFERGSNYLYWGSARSDNMAEAIRNISRRQRDRLVVTVQSYSRSALLMRASLERAIQKLGLDRADVLLLGWWNHRPPTRIVDEALRLKERGRVRALAISCHNRPMFAEFAKDGIWDVLMCRYNAVHRGAEREVFPLLPSGSPTLLAYTATRWASLCNPAKTPPGERTPAGSDCYRFVLSHPRVDMALTGPANEAQMNDALRALDLGPMGPDEQAWMRRVGDHIYAHDRGFRLFADRTPNRDVTTAAVQPPR